MVTTLLFSNHYIPGLLEIFPPSMGNFSYLLREAERKSYVERFINSNFWQFASASCIDDRRSASSISSVQRHLYLPFQSGGRMVVMFQGLWEARLAFRNPPFPPPTEVGVW